jgi:Holliday junction DNA helicase RuvA
MSFEDRQAFIMLRSVSGIGPKIALAILSTFDAASLRQVILQNKASLLESVPGIGGRTAEKIVLELRSKIERLGQPGTLPKARKAGATGNTSSPSIDNVDGLLEDTVSESVLADVRSALENLGYKDKEINPVISEILRNPEASKQDGFQVVLKSALKSLRASY